jgi:hypothetical protein
VPPPIWRARIVGVHSKAISLLHADGALVSLVRGAKDMEARAIALEGRWERFARLAERALEQADERRQAFVAYRRTGADSSGQDAALSLGMGESAGGGRPLSPAGDGAEPSLCLDDALPWDPRDELREHCAALNMTKEGLSAAMASSLALLNAFLARTRSESSDGIGGMGPFAAAFTGLKERRDFPACLVGFGPGTTPAGDDWLAGFLAASELAGCAGEAGVWAAGYGAPRAETRGPRPGPAWQALAELRKDIKSRLHRTGAAGRSLLLGALAGAPPAYLLRVRQACLSCAADGGAALSQAMADAQRHGASSGRDSLEGFRAGLESIQDFSPRE